MTSPDIKSPDHTDLKKVDNESFFEAIDSPPMPIEALLSAFRRAKTRSVQRDTGPATTD